MKSHKSALLGLALAATALGLTACEDKTDVVIPPPPPQAVLVSLVPDAITIPVGGTQQLVASVTGGAANGDRSVTFASDKTAIATVDANGVVTGVAAGQAVITATSVQDPNAKDASVVTVGGGAGGQPQVSIKSITNIATNVPVNIANVQNQIDITLNLNVPDGTVISSVQTLIDDVVVCEQTFTTGSASVSASEDEPNADSELVCSVNTAAYDAATGAVAFPNGPHTVSAKVIGPQGTILAEAPPTQFSQLTFNNVNFVVATAEGSAGTALSGAGPRSLAPVGSLWHGGDITVTMLAVIYNGADNNIQNAVVALTSSGTGVTGVGGCTVPTTTTYDATVDPTVAAADGGAGGANFPDCAIAVTSENVAGATGATFAATFPADETMANGGVEGVEDVFLVNITSVTATGGAGPVCLNPDPVTNPQGPTCLNVFGTQLRVDNLAPRVTELDIVRPSQYYSDETFVLSHETGGIPDCDAPCAVTVDYGVDSQTATGNSTFMAGTSSSTLIAVTKADDLPESQVATTNVFAIQTGDALHNERTVYATGTATTVSTSSTNAAVLKFGIDLTDPTVQFASGPPSLSTNYESAPPNGQGNPPTNTWVISFTDAGIGPSGFAPNPVAVTLELITPSGTECYDPTTVPASLGDCDDAPFLDDGSVTLPVPGTDGYWQVTSSVTDAAGNPSVEVTRIELSDYTAPTVGGIASPATITGGAAAAFSSSLSDNVEFGDLLAYTGFGASGVYLQQDYQVLGAYGIAALTATSAGAVNIASFIRSVETTTAGVPNDDAVGATEMTYLARDQAGVELADACPAVGSADGSFTQNCTLRTVSITAAVAAPVAGDFSGEYQSLIDLNGLNAAHGLFTQLAPSDDPVCTVDPGDCTPSSTPTSTTLSATVTGPNATFANPFNVVNFYYQDAGGRWVLIGTGSVTVTDNTVLAVRTYTFTTTWTPAGFTAGVYQVVAIGINGNGAALLSANQPVTLIDS